MYATGIADDMSSYSNMPRIIDISNRKIRTRIFNEIDRKQDGLCRYCKRDFKPTDSIISNGKHRKYYHEGCAVILSIIQRPHQNEQASLQTCSHSEESFTHLQSQSLLQPVMITSYHATGHT